MHKNIYGEKHFEQILLIADASVFRHKSQQTAGTLFNTYTQIQFKQYVILKQLINPYNRIFP